MSDKKQASRRLVVLGSTGSIGVNTLDVVRHLRASELMDIEIVGLAAGRNASLAIEQARAFKVPTVAMADEQAAQQVQAALPGVKVRAGADAAVQLVEESGATDLSAAIVGSAGLRATLAGIRRGMRIGLANKETLVAAGAIVTPEARRHGSCLLPVDSEHSAIFQCMAGQNAIPVPQPPGQGEGHAAREQGSGVNSAARCVKRIVLTASGGPFRTKSIEEMRAATVEEALAHPTWKMGSKISIDSATMMNKALEIIEAHWLFDLPGDKIGVVIHPQSIAHSFVEFDDNSVLAQLGPPDMRTPIQYALTYPERMAGCSREMDWLQMGNMEFSAPDYAKFPALSLAYDVIEAGGTAGAVFNAANEAAVEAFLERRIPFGRIVEMVAETLSAIAVEPADSLETILEADRQARCHVRERLSVRA